MSNIQKCNGVLKLILILLRLDLVVSITLSLYLVMLVPNGHWPCNRIRHDLIMSRLLTSKNCVKFLTLYSQILVVFQLNSLLCAVHKLSLMEMLSQPMTLYGQ